MSDYVTRVVIRGEDATKGAVTSATNGIKAYGNAVATSENLVRRGTRAQRAMFTQLGYQVQDVAVQMQAGQSALVVLAQQGSQVASLFGPAGAIVGAFLAVGSMVAGMFVPSMFEGSDAMKDVEDSANSLLSRFNELEGAALITARSLAFIEAQKKAKELEGYQSELKITSERMDRLARNMKANGPEYQAELERYYQLKGAIEQTKSELEDFTNKSRGQKDETSNSITELEKWRAELENSIATVGMSADELAIFTAVQNGANQADLERLHTLLMLNKELREIAEAEREAARARREAQRAAEQRAKLVLADRSAYNELRVSLSKAREGFEEYDRTVSRINQLTTIDPNQKADLINEAWKQAQAAANERAKEDANEREKAVRIEREAYNQLRITLMGVRDEYAEYDQMVRRINDLNVDAATKAEMITAAWDKFQPKEEKSPFESWAADYEKNMMTINDINMGIANTLQASMGDALQGIVQGTTTVREGFLNIANAISGQILNSLGQMAAQWLINKAISQTTGAAITAATAAQASAIGSMWAGPAALASLATLGGNAGPATAALTATTGVAQGLALAPSFEGGGYTGAGSRSGGMDGRGGFPAILHPNETVVDHTKDQAPIAPAPQNIRIVNAFDTSVIGDYMSTSEGERAIMNVVRRNQRDIRSIVA